MKGYKALKKRKRRTKFTRKQLVMTCLAASLLLGVIIGSIYTFVQGESNFKSLHDNLDSYFKGFTGYRDNLSYTGFDAFRESSLKYVKLTVIIWILAYFPAGGFVVVGLIFLRGFGYGLTTSALIRVYGTGGAICAAMLYLVQAVILVPTYFYVARGCFSFMYANLSTKSDEVGMINYFVPLSIGCVCCMLAGAVDGFVVPILVERFL